LQIKTKIVTRHTADSKPDKQEVNGTVILPHLVFPVTSTLVYYFWVRLEPTQEKPFTGLHSKGKLLFLPANFRKELNADLVGIWWNFLRDLLVGLSG